MWSERNEKVIPFKEAVKLTLKHNFGLSDIHNAISLDKANFDENLKLSLKHGLDIYSVALVRHSCTKEHSEYLIKLAAEHKIKDVYGMMEILQGDPVDYKENLRISAEHGIPFGIVSAAREHDPAHFRDNLKLALKHDTGLFKVAEARVRDPEHIEENILLAAKHGFNIHNVIDARKADPKNFNENVELAARHGIQLDHVTELRAAVKPVAFKVMMQMAELTGHSVLIGGSMIPRKGGVVNKSSFRKKEI
jgi:hypothetical protein